MKMPTIVHINSFNSGSTGEIMRKISEKSINEGFQSWVSFPASRTNSKMTIENKLVISNKVERNIHIKLGYFTGMNGEFSRLGTMKFLKQLDAIKPDVIHLHNLHNCYINLRMLFDYVKKKDITVVWTLHDCWAFTGQCTHFSQANCRKWEKECYTCPLINQYPESRIDNTTDMYHKKRKWFTGVDKLVLITPSHWLASQVGKSFLKDYPVRVINNGIDLNIFQPTKSDFLSRYGLENKKIILGVANSWNNNKGLSIFIELSKKVDASFQIILVGLTDDQIRNLPNCILGIGRTRNRKQLAEIYSAAHIFLNPSKQETMGLVTVESLACGTPVVVSNLTAVPEMINETVGTIVEDYSVNGFYNAVLKTLNRNIEEGVCVNFSEKYNQYDRYQDYVNLYTELIEN